VSDENPRSEILRNCRQVGVLIFCTFAWVSILTFSPLDWPNDAVWPHAVPAHNACGLVGAWFSYQFVTFLGVGCYPLFFFLTLVTVMQLMKKSLSDLPLRALGGMLIVIITAASAALIDPHPSEGLVEGRGGVIGLALANFLRQNFDVFGSTLVVGFVYLLGFVLAAHELMTRVPALAHWLSETLVNVIASWRKAGQGRIKATPMLIGAGNHSSTATTKPARKKKAAKPEPEPEPEADEEEAGYDESEWEEDGEYEEDAEAEDEYEYDDEEYDEEDYEEEGAVDGESSEEGDAEEEDTPVNRDLIIRMLGRDRKTAPKPQNAWPKELGDYVLPPLDLLDEPEIHYNETQEAVVREKADILERTLREFKIDIRVVEIDTGPVITMFELELAAGTKVSQINSLANDIARALKAPAVRIVAPIPGKNTVGVEVPNADKEKVRLKELVMLGGVKPTKMSLPVFIGKDASGAPLIQDISSMPHMLIAGTTGSGKSVAINTIIMSLLMTQRPDHCKLILVDPKVVELSIFKDVPHLMCPIVTDMQKAEMILDWATQKMDERYELLAEAGVRDIKSFNKLDKDALYKRFHAETDEEKMQVPTHLPYIVIVIDELADLMMISGKEVELHLSRLAQKSRAVGIHLIVATQRPQATVVTGLIKANLPTRMAFRVASRMDSRIVLDQNGAEVLMGQGDMLFLPPGESKVVRSQGTYLEDDELRRVLDDLAEKAKPQFHHELTRLRPKTDGGGGERDPLFDKAVEIIVASRRGSVSLLQRKLTIGYSRSSRLIEQMAEAGLVGDYKGSQAREVLITEKEWNAIKHQRNKEMDEDNYQADLDAEDDDVYGTADMEEEVEA